MPYKIRSFTCKNCKTVVTKSQPKGRQFCCRQCFNEFGSPARRTGKNVECPICKKIFYVIRSRLKPNVCCSIECGNKWQGRNKIDCTCKVCEKSFLRSKSMVDMYDSTYCSIKCLRLDPTRTEILIEMSALQQQSNETSIEKIGYRMLDELGLEFERQKIFNGKFTPDATISSLNIVVQFDGDYWHDKQGNSHEPRILRRVALDKSQDQYMQTCGWYVIRFWESDLNNNYEECKKRMLQFVVDVKDRIENHDKP